MARLKLPGADALRDWFVVRYAKAYPVYDAGYQKRVAVIRALVDGIENLACVGRYGQFRYNNMDHSIMTAMLAVRRLLGDDVDPWSANEEADYHEDWSNSRANSPETLP
jgi:protoporphyrinogen oxidase